ncbi:hypothetical protein ACFO3D_15460 [Virgibacillus kekensis]|uniref:Lipoprotein n=1 Tax=Virgibacillus kekensis TaxID=202261 RepID=A0ABV9DL56_9BACI
MKKVMLLIGILVIGYLTGCNNDESPEAKETKEPKKYTMQEALDAGHVVVESREAGFNKVHRLEKVFAFDKKVDEKAKNISLNITTVNDSDTKTASLKFDGEVIHYKSGDYDYQCNIISTYNDPGAMRTPAKVFVQQCTNSDGNPSPDFSILSTKPEYYFQVKEEFEEQQ